jgi:inosose dehydratase
LNAVRIASAPVSFGVDEVQSDAFRPTPEAIVKAIAGLHLTGMELGPPGFLGDPAATRALLDGNGLALVGAYFPLRFSRREHIDQDLAALRSWLDDLRVRTPDGSSPKAIIADDFCEPDRIALAGSIDRHPDTWLPAHRRQLLVDSIHRAAELCQHAGFDAVIHPHVGTYLEREDEIRWVSDRLDASLVGLCLDTGHIRFGGGHPATIASDYRHLVRHVHAKDCDPSVRASLRANPTGLRGAMEQGIFCELGSGDAEIDAVMSVLQATDYAGWIVLEQDRNVAPGTPLSELVASVERNAAFVRARVSA